MPLPLVTISNAAAARLRAMMDEAGDTLAGLRIGVRANGAAEFVCYIEHAEERGAFDEVLEHNGVRLFIDPKALMLLMGGQIDWRDDQPKAGFVVCNPTDFARVVHGGPYRA